MDTQRLLQTAARGVHLLFDTRTIAEAFEQDAEVLRAVIEREMESIQSAVHFLLQLPNADQGREFIASLPRLVQYVIVLLYFELVDGQIRRHAPTIH